MAQFKLDIDYLITIDDNGMPKAPTVRQLLDKDIRDLYNRDPTDDKHIYIQECIVIYYLGDPKSPARQSGLSDPEALKMAMEQANLPKSYVPDNLVLKLIKRYYEQNITEAGRVVENILKGLHNINLSVSVINNLITEKLSTGIDLNSIGDLLSNVNKVNDIAGSLPKLIKQLEEAKENLMYEKETETSRGGGIVTSSMDAENYM